MTHIFDTETPESGFRLTVLELFNWGTFDKKVCRIYPGGKSSLLTGSNGSGKTTIADAVLTLLVPPGKRHYNQSSGTDKKRDRTEETYVKGAFKTTQSEGELSAKTQYLRTVHDFSVILGVFFNQDMNETLTLAQVRWFSGGQLKQLYMTSPDALNVQEHFNPLDPDGKWKKRLAESCRAEFFNSFQQYSLRFAKVFGLKSHKALNLFSQTVGIKVLGNLNEFIRSHMLEEPNIEQDFAKLRENYHNLLFSHKAIEKAKAQLDLLKPVMEGGERFEKASGELNALESAKEAVPAFFAERKKELLSAAIEENNETLRHVTEDIETAEKTLSDLDREKEELIVAISKDKVSEEIGHIERDIEILNKDKDARQNHAAAYNRIAQGLDLPQDPDESLFRQTAAEISRQKSRYEGQAESLMSEWGSLQNKLKEVEKEFDEVRRELESLMNRKSNIPRKNLDVRKRITQALNIAETEIPFVGELVRVKETELIWESAIERLMRPFGLNLLVPETYYRQFNQHVNHVNLYARIVYHKVSERIAPELFPASDPDSLISKLEIKSDTVFRDWIEGYIRKVYNYICAQDLKDFERLDKSITPSGLIKNFERHEKDDRPGVTDKANYVFGWDNAEKIRCIQKQAAALDSQRQEAKKFIRENTEKRHGLERKKQDLAELSRYDRFSMLDWKSLVKDIEALKSRKQKLLESADKLRTLKDQLSELRKTMTEKKKEKDELSRSQALIEENIRQHKGEYKENSELLEACSHADLEIPFASVVSYVSRRGKPVRLETIRRIRDAVSSDIDRDITYQRDETSRIERQIIRNMGIFKEGNEDIREKYPDWTADTVNLEPDVSYLNEYRAIYDRIRAEDLPKYKQRFKQYMNKQMAYDVINFREMFHRRIREIRESIREINQSLKEIDYNTNPGTYIMLTEKNENDIRIRDFKEKLEKAIPDVAKLAREDEQELEFAFNNIRELIEKLSDEAAWRAYVTDVRNWLKFAAEEKYRADDAQKQYYEDSQSLSGGEKAKLAYTVLASAIAYQFGIQREHNLKSFRFVVVDEAFSKVDPENSVYAMELFKRLNLQLMLVTPLDKINLVEKYIHAVHYVENKQQRESSVYDLTMAEYYKKKELFRP